LGVARVRCRAFRDRRDRLGQAHFRARRRRLCRIYKAVLVNQRRYFRQCLLLPIGLPKKATAGDCQYDDDRRDHCTYSSLFPPLPLGATEDIVSGKTRETGDGFGKAEVLPVRAFAQIRAEDGDGPVGNGDGAVGGKLIAQRWRKIVGSRAVNDDRDHWPVRVA
jgi:hypothetical protein